MKKVIYNTAAFYIIRIILMLSPIVVLPLLSRLLNHDDFAYYLFLISLGTWMSLIVEFGFVISGTRAIASNKNEITFIQNKLKIVNNSKLFLSFILLCFAIGFYFISNNLIYLLAWLYAVLLGLNFTWFFQGLQKVKVLLVAELASTLLFILSILAIFFLSGTLIWVIFSLLFTRMLNLIVCYLYVKHNFSTKGMQVSLLNILHEIKSASSAFFLVSFVSLYTSFNVVFLGIMATGVQLIYFAGSEKIVRAGCSLLAPISQAFLPEMSIRFKNDIYQAFRIFKWMLMIVTLLGIGMHIFVILFAKWFILILLGNQYIEAVSILNVLSAILPAVAFSSVLSMHFLMPFGKEAICAKIYLISGIINVLLAVIFVSRFGAMALAFSVVICEYVVAILMLCVAYNLKRKLFKRMI
ncbi:oligosaccharide flippase family protein [bacterium SCSIO 12844]|nr:oligosaccharide flippase family protein [bacterium SCSIO 12844]